MNTQKPGIRQFGLSAGESAAPQKLNRNCIQLDKEECYYLQGGLLVNSWIKETVLTNLGRRSLFRGAIFELQISQEKKAVVEIFLHTLSTLRLSPLRKASSCSEPQVRKALPSPHRSEALRYRTWLYLCPQHTVTQDFTYSRLPQLPMHYISPFKCFKSTQAGLGSTCLQLQVAETGELKV